MSCHIRLLSAHTIPPPLSHVGTGGSTWGRAPASLSNVAFRAEPKKQCINTTLFLNEKSVYKHCFCRVARRRPTKKLCLYTVLFWVDAAQHGKNRVYTQFYRSWTKLCLYTTFFGSARNAALRKLLPASRSLLLFPPLFRTAWFPPPAPTDLSHGFSTILAKHKTDQTEPPKHNTHLVFFDIQYNLRLLGSNYRHHCPSNSC